MAGTMIKLGALWLRESKDGKRFMSGKMGDAQLICFKNDRKQSDKHPDYILYITPPYKKEEQDEQKQDEEIPF